MVAKQGLPALLGFWGQITAIIISCSQHATSGSCAPNWHSANIVNILKKCRKKKFYKNELRLSDFISILCSLQNLAPYENALDLEWSL